MSVWERPAADCRKIMNFATIATPTRSVRPTAAAGTLSAGRRRGCVTRSAEGPGVSEASAVVEADGKAWRVHWMRKEWRERQRVLEKRVALDIAPWRPVLD